MANGDGKVVLTENHQDSLDAGLRLQLWLTEIGERLGPTGWVEEYGLRMLGPDKDTAMPAGRVLTVWDAGGMVGQAIIVRTPFNWSTLTIVEF